MNFTKQVVYNLLDTQTTFNKNTPTVQFEMQNDIILLLCIENLSYI